MGDQVNMVGLDKLLKGIASGKPVKSDDLLPYLCLENVEERRDVNIDLAKAYFESGNFRQAKVFIDRAWLLSGFSESILPLYIDVHRKLGDMDSIREGYKRLGMIKAESGELESALSYFYQSMYTYALNQGGDYYKYDFDVLEAIERLAEPHRFEPEAEMDNAGNGKVRLAYLVFGGIHLQSVIVKILCLFAKFHDKDRFDIVFFVPENELSIFPEYKIIQKNIDRLMEHGDVVFVTNGTNQSDMLHETAKKIHDYKPDIMVTSALLADLKQYFIASLHPAPIIIGFSHGPPPQFSAPILDWSITWSKHPLIDCPGNCSLVPLEVELPELEYNTTVDRAEYDIPEDSVVLVSAGRQQKFLDRNFWVAVTDLLRAHPESFFIAIGLGEEPPFLNELLAGDLRARVRFFGWTDNYIGTLKLGDIMLDTYPSGGGVTLMDAMALGIPVLSFKNNYMKIFDQTDWSPAEELIKIPDLLAERYNLDQFKTVASKLIEDKDFRMKMGEACKSQVRSRNGHPERTVKRCEEIYEKVLKNKKVKKQLSKDYDAKKSLPTSNLYGLLEDRVNFWRFKEELYDRIQSITKNHQRLQSEHQALQQQHQALQQSRAVVLARKLGDYPLLMKLASAGYAGLTRLYHLFKRT